MVMFGHNWLDKKFGYYFFSFHMPLFFILAGITFSVKRDFKSFVWQKFRTLLIPYLFFAVCFLAFYGVLSYTHCGDFDLRSNAIGFLLQNHHTILWFLAALFLAEIISYLIVKFIINRYSGGISSILIATIAVFLICVHYWTVTMGWIKLIWCIDLVPICVAFLLIGILYRKYEGRVKIESSLLYIGTLFIISLISSTCSFLKAGSVDMFNSQFGIYPLFITGALAATYFLFLVLRKVTLPQWLLYIGTYSLVYYGFHRFIIEIMVVVYSKLGITFDFAGLSGVCLALVNIIVACIVIYPVNIFINTKCPWLIGRF